MTTPEAKYAEAIQKAKVSLTTLPFGLTEDCWVNVPEKRYHAELAASKHTLDYLVDGTPAHLFEAMINPDREEKSDTSAKIEGTVQHKAILEPEDFDNCYAIIPEEISALNKNTKEYKEKYAAFLEANKGLEPITKEMRDRAFTIAKVLKSHPVASKLIQGGNAEVTGVWRDVNSGLACKMRVDYLTDEHIVDLKSAESVTNEDFARAIHNYGYHRQNAHYLDGAKEIDGRNRKYYIVAWEKKPPYAVRVFTLPERAVNFAREQLRDAKQTLASALSESIFNAYSPEVETIDLPAFAYREATVIKAEEKPQLAAPTNSTNKAPASNIIPIQAAQNTSAGEDDFAAAFDDLFNVAPTTVKPVAEMPTSKQSAPVVQAQLPPVVIEQDNSSEDMFIDLAV